MRIGFKLNGQAQDVDVHPGESLLELLRRSGAVSVKNGCSNGDCGSCAVLLDGRAVTSCLLFAGQVDGHELMTTEGLATTEGLHPLQQGLLETGGVQCGFCTPGILMTAVDLFSRAADPTDEDIRHALAGNLCRCTGYVKIVEGVQAAAALLRTPAEPLEADDV